MNKKLTLIIFLLICNISKAKSTDLFINDIIEERIISYSFNEPLVIIYDLFDENEDLTTSEKFEELAKLDNKCKRTPFHFFVGYGFQKESILKILKEKGYDINAKDSDGIAPIHLAIAKKSVKLIEILLKNGASINTKYRGLVNLITFATWQNCDEEIYSKLVSNGANINYIDIDGYSPIYDAIISNNVKIFKLFLKIGANVKIYDKNKFPSNLLHFAVFTNADAEIMKILVDNGVNINQKDFDGLTPLHCAIHDNNIKAITTLVNLGANINILTDKGLNLLGYAIEVQSGTQTLSKVLNLGLDINHKDVNGNTPLHNAIINGQNYQRIKWLLDNNSNLLAKNNDNLTPFDLCKNNIKLETLFHEYGYINSHSKDVTTAETILINKEINGNKATTDTNHISISINNSSRLQDNKKNTSWSIGDYFFKLIYLIILILLTIIVRRYRKKKISLKE